MPPDRFAVLAPPELDQMRLAWDQLRVPGPPPDYALTTAEALDPDPGVRYARRTIQRFVCGADRLALIDKVAPHSRYDLMISEVSTRPKATPDTVAVVTGRMLWRTGASFVRFVSCADVIHGFALEGGAVRLALNCDPHTQDRESVQAAKQFHLHLLYWPEEDLRMLDRTQPFSALRDPRARRQAIDPLAFLGAWLVHDALADLDLGVSGARLATPDPVAALAGRVPMGGLILLPGWSVLETPGFETLIRRVHQRLESLARDLTTAFTGRRDIPAPWTRHALRPLDQIRAALDGMVLSDPSRLGLERLAGALASLPEPVARRLRDAAPERRTQVMTLNQPAYALSLDAPRLNRIAAPIAQAPLVHLAIQPRLFSGIGGAGLLGLAGVPCVRILRGQGMMSGRDWRRRAAFQRRFAAFNTARWAGETAARFESVRRFAGARPGWVPTSADMDPRDRSTPE